MRKRGILKILGKIPDKTPAQKRRLGAARVTELNHPSDHYQFSDLLGFSSEAFSVGLLGINGFMRKHPAFSVLIATFFSLVALPTFLKVGLKVLVAKVNKLHLAARTSAVFPQGKFRTFMGQILNNYVFSRFKLAGAATIADFDFSQLSMQMNINPPSFSGDTDLSGLQDNAQAAASATADDAIRVEGVRQDQVLDSASTAVKEKFAEVEDRALRALLENFNALSKLGINEKNDLCRYVLKHFPDRPELTDLIIQECQKTKPLVVAGFELPESPFSRSLVHAVKYVFAGLGAVVSAPRFLLDLLRGHQSTLTRKYLASGKMLLTDSWTRIAASCGLVLSSCARLMVVVIKVPVGALDRGLALLKFLKVRLFGLKKHFSPVDAEAVQLRARVASKLENGLSNASSKMNKTFGLNELKAKTQGVKAFRRACQSDIPVDVVANPLQQVSRVARLAWSRSKGDLSSSVNGSSTPRTPGTPRQFAWSSVGGEQAI